MLRFFLFGTFLNPDFAVEFVVSGKKAIKTGI